MSELEQVRADFVALWGSLAPFWGVTPATGRVYAWLLSSAVGATAEDLMAGLDMSRGAVSMAARELRDFGLLEVTREPGSRQQVLRPVTDLERAIRGIVQARKRREWDPLLERLRAWIPRLQRERSREASAFAERLREIEGLVGLADSMADSFLKGGLVQRLGIGMLVRSAKKKGKQKSSR
jgi:DNA-binding transcriptional regulator GbsR (MarR family)